ncbi:MAG: hypothetical protein HOO67_02575 [Candidatus Peribacteraceae bacterium]|nr:hypothetical protein [Candidatus Peribacteraceae bacterium]
MDTIDPGESSDPQWISPSAIFGTMGEELPVTGKVYEAQDPQNKEQWGGQGTRGRIRQVLLREHVVPSDPRSNEPETAGPFTPYAMKQYRTVDEEGTVVNTDKHDKPALNGYRAIASSIQREARERQEAGLPPARSHLIENIIFDEENHRIYTPLLSHDGTHVVSVGRNQSHGRNALFNDQIRTIPNFSEFLKEFIHDILERSKDRIAVDGDVYFFLVNPETHVIDYVHADFERVGFIDRKGVKGNNLAQAASAIRHFLLECCKNPERYLREVREYIQKEFDRDASSESQYSREIFAEIMDQLDQDTESYWQSVVRFAKQLMGRNP